MHRRSFLTAMAMCIVVVVFTMEWFPYQEPLAGTADIAGVWRGVSADEIANLPYKDDGYPAAMIDQVSAQRNFDQTGSWPTSPDSPVYTLCGAGIGWAFANAPCGEFKK